MVDLELLRVSLTKNGYFKVASLLKDYPRAEVLDHLTGDRAGIHLAKSQIANMLDAHPATGEIPEYWDLIREHGDKVIDAFSVVAMLFSHCQLIRLMQAASEGRPEFTGYFLRQDLGKKAYTNFAYALACFGLAPYRRGARAVSYNLAPALFRLRPAGNLVQELLRHKLQRAGWRDPALHRVAPDRPLLEELEAQQFHRVLSLGWPRFAALLGGRLRMAAPAGPFGLREVGLFEGGQPV